jgi:hypothetical protein
LIRSGTKSHAMKPTGLDWLLEREDPPIRFFALRDILGRSSDTKEVVDARAQIKNYSPVRKVLRARTREGYWPPKETFYTPKWRSSVWPMMLLGEMGLTPDPGVKRACEMFLDMHQLENGAFTCPTESDVVEYQKKHPRKKAVRWEEPCLTGNMIRTLIVFGYGDDPRVKRAIQWMPEQQLPDGGWNCDYPEKKVKHSSFMSTIEPLWAYSEIPRAKWTRNMKQSIEQGAEFMLMHRLYKSDNHHWKHSLPFSTSFHFPMYYFYDALHGLRVLGKLGYGDDERVRDAVHLILSKRSPDGKWLLEGDWSREPEAQENKRKALVDIEELWKPSKWVTLNAFRALSATGDLDVSRR